MFSGLGKYCCRLLRLQKKRRMDCVARTVDCVRIHREDVSRQEKQRICQKICRPGYPRDRYPVRSMGRPQFHWVSCLAECTTFTFDQVLGSLFEGVEGQEVLNHANIQPEWLKLAKFCAGRLFISC